MICGEVNGGQLFVVVWGLVMGESIHDVCVCVCVCVCVTYIVLVRGPFDLVAGSYADAGGEGGFEFDGESGERGGGEEGG